MNKIKLVEMEIKRSTVVRIYREDLIAFIRENGYPDIHEDAEVFMTVPGGGDWSNMQLDVDSNNPIEVTWATVEVNAGPGQGGYTPGERQAEAEIPHLKPGGDLVE